MINTVVYAGVKLLPLYPPPLNSPKMAIKLAVSSTYVYGQLVKETGTPGTYTALASGADTAGVAILEFDVVTDAAGLHYHGSQASNDSGIGEQHTSAFMAGGGLSFDTRDLCINNARGAITAVQVTSLGAILVSGTVAAGIIQM